MPRLWIVLTLICVLTHAVPGSTAGTGGYYERYDLLGTPPSVYKEGLLGFANPANLTLLNAPELQFRWSTRPRRVLGLDDWGLYGALPHVGFGAQRRKSVAGAVTDYSFGVGFGSGAHASGISYGWSAGDKELFGSERQLVTAQIFRPHKSISLGLSGRFGLEHARQEWVGEAGVRPLGSPVLTLFADLAWAKRQRLERAPWSAGGVLRLANGIDLSGRLFDGDAFTLGIQVGLGRSGLGSQGRFDSEGDYSGQSYMVRSGGLRPSPFNHLAGRRSRYVAMNWQGRVEYLHYSLFDKKAGRFYEILRDVQAAADDPRVGALAVNLSGLEVAPELAWELRRALSRARAAGVRVVAFIDRARMTTYHLASVADVIVMDPEGMLLLEGYSLGRTYFQGTLARLGLAFDEWRFFRYKSAVESLSRHDMSDADREQHQAFVDDWYETTRKDVGEGRRMAASAFDRLVDERTIFLPGEALASGLVDTLARWSDLGRVLEATGGGRLSALSAGDLVATSLNRETWGTRPRIALVYALGVCDLDRGIRARWLDRTLRGLARDASVRAIVLRVDSPGGDALASDLVAEALRTCKRSKPVIVSQGQVAGSGGYWISMYGDRILAGPTTVTGSIGVIGGWLYDSAFTERLGMSSDQVKRGAHADFQSGVRLPFIGVTVPKRNLTPEERLRVEETVRAMYDRFLAKVAEGRGLDIDSVGRIAEGRFYSGIDGAGLGLVDEIGGLGDALAVARAGAGLAPEDDVEIVEYPGSLGLFDLGRLRPGLDTAILDEAMLEYIRLVSRAAGGMVPLLPPGSYPGRED